MLHDIYMWWLWWKTTIIVHSLTALPFMVLLKGHKIWKRRQRDQSLHT
jgi:hypothetical protein